MQLTKQLDDINKKLTVQSSISHLSHQELLTMLQDNLVEMKEKYLTVNLPNMYDIFC